MVKYERKILQISKIKEIDMKTLIVTGGSLDISWAKDFVRTINAEYIIAADSGLKYIDELGLVPDMILSYIYLGRQVQGWITHLPIYAI